MLAVLDLLLTSVLDICSPAACKQAGGFCKLLLGNCHKMSVKYVSAGAFLCSTKWASHGLHEGEDEDK